MQLQHIKYRDLRSIMKKTIALLTLLIVFTSCNEFQRALKSEDVAVKFTAATKQYEKGKYEKAIRLFDQIAPAYRGKPNAERLFYMYAQSFYKTKQYSLAGYQFESFAASYPKSEKLEEASFLGAKSYTMLSPVYSLDQTDTNKAIEKLQVFIDSYPESTYLPQSNALMQEMKGKIEKKVFENAKQYNTISDFKASQIAFTNFIDDFPGTKFKEEALFYKFDSSYKLALNSVQDKMKERLIAAKAEYAALIKFRPNSKFKAKADDMIATIETDLKQFSK